MARHNLVLSVILLFTLVCCDNDTGRRNPYLQEIGFRYEINLNLDQKKIQEVVFDPESRVERSVRVVKEGSNARNKANRAVPAVTLMTN